MTITISGHTIPVDDTAHAERLLAIAATLDQDRLEQWLYAGAPEPPARHASTRAPMPA